MTTEEILFFDKLSDNWDANEVLSTPEKINEILDLIGIREGSRILDLGTGTGVLVPYLSRRVGSNGHVKAIDISEGMLGKAKEKFGELQNVTFEKLDFEKEDIDGRYDLVMMYCVFPHLHTPRATLKKLIQNNLAPSGRIIIAFPSDESFINNIHKEKKAESDMLPSAPELSKRIGDWGFFSSVLAYDSGRYVVQVRPNFPATIQF